MTPMRPKTPLERVLREVRAQRPPEPREAALPARLRAEFRSFAAQPPSTLRRTGSRFAPWQLAAAAALAAGGALVALRAAAPEHTGPEPPAPMLASLDGEPLEVGVPVVAAAAPRLVQHAERASWLLQPGSRATLRAREPIVRVDLELGSLTAQVRPSEQPESFVVLAQGTEVAVRGTRFSVALHGDRVRVEVLEGNVLVRPEGQSAGTLLGQHRSAEFLAGALVAPAAPAEQAAGLSPQAEGTPVGAQPDTAQPSPARRSPVVPPSAADPAQQAGAARLPAGQLARAKLPPARAAASSPDPAERDLQLVSEHVRDCFRRQLPGSRELGVEVSTRLGLWVEASGQILRAHFEPPLAPDIERCVAEKLVQFRAAPSPEGYRVERDLLLKR